MNVYTYTPFPPQMLEPLPLVMHEAFVYIYTCIYVYRHTYMHIHIDRQIDIHMKTYIPPSPLRCSSRFRLSYRRRSYVCIYVSG